MFSSTLKMEPVCSSETSIKVYETMPRRVLEDRFLQVVCCRQREATRDMHVRGLLSCWALSYSVGFEVFTAVIMKIRRRVVCWVATDVSEEHIASIFRVEEIISASLPPAYVLVLAEIISSTLKIEAICSSLVLFPFVLISDASLTIRTSRDFSVSHKVIVHIATRFHAGFLLGLFFLPWTWRRYIPPKRPLTFNGLHGVISQNIVLFMTNKCVSFFSYEISLSRV
jgi:hypothetical protein